MIKMDYFTRGYTGYVDYYDSDKDNHINNHFSHGDSKYTELELYTCKFAEKCYLGELYKSYHKKTTYIDHVKNTVQILKGADEDDEAIICAAFLHEILECTNITLDDIREFYNSVDAPKRTDEYCYYYWDETIGERITLLVKECTRDKTLKNAESKRAEIERMKTVSNDVVIIKTASSISKINLGNIRTDREWIKYEYVLVCKISDIEYRKKLFDYLRDVCANYGIYADCDHNLEPYYSLI